MSEQAARSRGDRGQTLVLFAVLLPGLVALAAVGVDSANLFLRYRDAQSAADLAALAGARSLTPSPTALDQAAARSAAASVATSNGYSTGVTVTTPYGGNDLQLEVQIAATTPTYFARLLGLTTFNLSVRAVAESEWSVTGGTFPAIFANCASSSQCQGKPAIEWSGSNGNRVIGGIHSNCGISVPGSNNTVTGSTTYKGGSGCTFSNSGSGNSYTPSAATGPNQAFPVSYTASSFTCTPSLTRSGKLELKNHYLPGTKTLVPGVYCATGSDAEIILGDSGVTGNVTLVVNRGSESCTSGSTSSNGVTIGGGSFNLTAFDPSRVLIYSNVREDKHAVRISGSHGSWSGLIVAPCSLVEISGQATSTSGGGSILANRVNLNGSDVVIDSNGLNTLGPPSLVNLRLLE